MIPISLKNKREVSINQMTMVGPRPSLEVFNSLVQVAEPVQVWGVELLSLLVSHSPAISKLVEVADEGAIRLHILVFRGTIIVSTKAKHMCLVGARQNHLCSGEKGLSCHC